MRPELREPEESESPKSDAEAVEYDTDSEVDDDEDHGNESSSIEGQRPDNGWEMVDRPSSNPVPLDRSAVLYQSWITID